MSSFIYMSKDALKKLKDELHEMKSVKRPEISEKISTARDFGDLKENAEYHAAKEAMAMLETRISQMEETVRRARVVDPKDLPDDRIAIYSNVTLKDVKRNAKVQYHLVSQEESDFKQMKISVSSPVGKALLGKTIGEKVSISVPAGTLEYEILDIGKSLPA